MAPPATSYRQPAVRVSLACTLCRCDAMTPTCSRCHLEGNVERALLTLEVITGFDMQAVLLYSIATYRGNETKRALDLLDKAIGMALELGLNKQRFALENGNGEVVLEESWRDLALASRQLQGVVNAQATCANLDATPTAWRSLLPSSEKDIVRADGSFDEILF
ncbi:hypothetical protein ETB97_006691 [Aspergillus alliaceus]|uniref:Uncharacterized protein n=1 Tax=Petromyces alliaceus TaxID=209559 RepID=A0A8H6E3C5_PETAA|nr:hypothetical protein ETB97_006691 [Aspergillus burnettii]